MPNTVTAPLLRLVRAVPAPTLIGIAASLLALFFAWILAANHTGIFAALSVALWFVLFTSEYKLPFDNWVALILLFWLGHGAVLGVKLLFGASF